MIRHILVPLDGSEFSIQAVPHALAIARARGAAITLVQVHVPVYPAMSMEGVAALDLELERSFEEQEEKFLADLASRFAQEAGMPVAHKLIHGDVVGALVEYARISHADMFVMTTHGRGGFSRAWLGSVAERLVRESTIPVLLSRMTHGALLKDSPHTFEHILVPLDGSALAESVLPFAFELGQTHPLYTLLQVREPAGIARFGYYAAAMLSDLEAENAADTNVLAYLNKAAAPLREHVPRVHTSVRCGTSPTLDIIDYARQYQVDLIALSTHGRRGMKRLALGSVAERLMRSFDGSVLVYRPTSVSASSTEAAWAKREARAGSEAENAGIS